VEANPEAVFAEPLGEELSPCQYWCNLTQTAVGPDDRPAHKHTCNSARTCFEE